MQTFPYKSLVTIFRIGCDRHLKIVTQICYETLLF